MNKRDRTSLYLFAQLDYEKAIKLLINKEALIFAIDNVERTTRDLTKEMSKKRVIKTLDDEQFTNYIFEDRLILL